MPALKDIRSFGVNLASSPLASSPLWHTEVDAIVPQQFFAFRTRLALEGYEGTESLFRAIAESVTQAKREGEITDAAALAMSAPQGEVFTLHTLARGFAAMTRPLPDAIVFALEVGLSAELIVTLTWEKVKVLADAKKLHAGAIKILNSQPRHITSKYVFWRDRNGKAEPLFGLELEVFEQYGMTWTELAAAYSGL